MHKSDKSLNDLKIRKWRSTTTTRFVVEDCDWRAENGEKKRKRRKTRATKRTRSQLTYWNTNRITATKRNSWTIFHFHGKPKENRKSRSRKDFPLHCYRQRQPLKMRLVADDENCDSNDIGMHKMWYNCLHESKLEKKRDLKLHLFRSTWMRFVANSHGEKCELIPFKKRTRRRNFFAFFFSRRQRHRFLPFL